MDTNPLGLIAFPDACRMMNLTERAARRLMNKDDDGFPRPAIKLGRVRYYRSIDALSAWLDQQAENDAATRIKGRRTRAAA